MKFPSSWENAESIDSLLSSRAPESQHLEFKRTFPTRSGNSDAAKETHARNVVNDIVQFANADGGVLIYGVEEKESHAASLAPLPGADAQAALQQIEQLLSNWTSPRLEVTTRTVSVNGGAIVVVEVAPQTVPIAVAKMNADRNGPMLMEFPYRRGAELRRMPPGMVASRMNASNRAKMISLAEFDKKCRAAHGDAPRVTEVRYVYRRRTEREGHILLSQTWGATTGKDERYTHIVSWDQESLVLEFRGPSLKPTVVACPLVWFETAWQDPSGSTHLFVRARLAQDAGYPVGWRPIV